jgi:hypothetical protein
MRTSTRQDWLAAAAVSAGLVGAYAVTPATTGPSSARAVASLAIGALIALAVARAPFTFAPRIRTGFVLLVLLALWYVATRAWAADPAGSMVESSRVSAFVLVAWASHTAVVGTAARRALLAAIGACALYVAWPAVSDLLHHGAPTVRATGRLGYWNATAIASLALVPLAAALAGTARTVLIAASALLIPVAGIAAVASASRGALIALLVGLLVQALLEPDYRGGLPRAVVSVVSLAIVVVGLTVDHVPEWIVIGLAVSVAAAGFGLIRPRRTHRDEAVEPVPVPIARSGEDAVAHDGIGRHRPPRATRKVGIAIVAALALLLVGLVVSANREQIRSVRDSSTGAPAPAAERLASTDDSMRLDWWALGIDIWERNPLVGEGGGAFALERYADRRPTPSHVHSMPLEVLLETGLVGFVLLVAASLQFLRVLRRGRRTPDRAVAGAIAALLIAQSLVDWTLSFPQVIALLAIAAPLAVQPPPEPAEAAVQERQLPPWAAGAMLASLAAATVVALVPALAALLADQGVRRLDAGEPVRATKLFDQSRQLVPSLETLSLQAISLQASDDAERARELLRENEQVWLTTQDGLELGQELLADDPVYGPRIDRALARIEHEHATAR